MTSKKIPSATYRLQFNQKFNLKDATHIIDYLHQLGITHIYASPLLKAKKGTTHGYDIVDHSSMNPDIGTEGDFESFVKSLKEHYMGIILDIVPNHMFIFDPSNRWWQDVLENGPASNYADYFDIDWNPPRKQLKNKVLLPVLEQQYGNALEKQTIKAAYKEGSFYVEIPGLVFPTDPCTWNLILEPLSKKAQEHLQSDNPYLQELQSIVTALSHLPSCTKLDKDKVAERLREKEVIKKRLAALTEQGTAVKEMIDANLLTLNGNKEDPRSFDALEDFVTAQPYRMCFWRVANDEINYRRFFDILDLAGIRSNKPEVFEAIHELVLKFMRKQLVDGLRIDHIDGLWDPEQYLQDLQKHCDEAQASSGASKPEKEEHSSTYIIAEKILIGNEKLRSDWKLDGTVGYDFLNQVNGLYIYQQNKKAIMNTYHNFTDRRITAFELMYTCKRLNLNISMSSELLVLARHLDSISEQHRSSRDFTAESLKFALREVISCFSVYRSYIQASENKIHDEDRLYITTAISRAKRNNPAISASIYDFLQSVLLLEHPSGLEPSQIAYRENFVMRFQQLTSPVMAKGVEDTAFYRYYPLASLREVGADLLAFGISVETFHKKNQERFELWPRTMNATSTHDTKRSEDVRARINVISEIPEEWDQALQRWSNFNQPLKTVDGDEVIPDTNEEYLFYQTVIGTWPLKPMDKDEHQRYVQRIQHYMEKAIKEAKIHTSWINPNKEYDLQVQQFIEKALFDSKDNPFLNDIKTSIQKISAAGMLNSLSQVFLKILSPGIPDIYQGNELWDFSLVDPDNRRPVNFALHTAQLKELQSLLKQGPSEKIIAHLMQHPEDGNIKLFVIQQSLLFRQKYQEVFLKGTYLPLEIKGQKENHIIAFTWSLGKNTVIVIASRFFTLLTKDNVTAIEANIWEDTEIVLPTVLSAGKFRNVLTGQVFDIENNSLSLSKVLSPLPIALLDNFES